ncbi:hypothetical protein PC41400_11505 [Paenibacillus chitinolyticus]|uniref:Uncharacterized protein n=1 Tax=Paenibacillus chitinolyticus TaxID=79263 RepID=A0A410WUV7_9BACL|nr:hypothetical protein [Paenibacillus chitinolyticus]MCY9589423.1 hypothetical protein [Paenibacillus chitinolyticus]MCY9594496.1 hypothetical protein [Paenibacillus chitinolyticus]QAV18256.1 hypothetical protein PC41400_11505 [Paenibacillus chitinolyticus]
MKRNSDFSRKGLKTAKNTAAVGLANLYPCKSDAIPVIVRGHVLDEGLAVSKWDKARLWDELDKAGVDSLLDVAYAEIRRDALILKSP